MADQFVSVSLRKKTPLRNAKTKRFGELSEYLQTLSLLPDEIDRLLVMDGVITFVLPSYAVDEAKWIDLGFSVLTQPLTEIIKRPDHVVEIQIETVCALDDHHPIIEQVLGVMCANMPPTRAKSLSRFGGSFLMPNYFDAHLVYRMLLDLGYVAYLCGNVKVVIG